MELKISQPSQQELPCEGIHAVTAGDRNQERKFKDWLGKCHSQLDKSLRFVQLADAEAQVPHLCSQRAWAICQ